MKNFLASVICLISLGVHAQTSKWFISVNPGFSIGGPISAVKTEVINQGFGQTANFSIFDLNFSTQYPRVERGGSFLVRAGKKISPYKSVYLTAGIAGSGQVTGYKSSGTYSSFLYFGGSDGEWVAFKYKVIQFGAGYQYSFRNTRAKLGIGPSIFLLHYSLSRNYGEFHYQTSVVPGLSVMARLPLGKEKRLVGVDLIVETTIAPPAHMQPSEESNSSFQPGAVNMIHATVGLALSFRKK